VEYLGWIVSKGQVAMDPVKTDAVKTWPVPTNKRELQQFLGFCNYYWKFIEGFSKLSNPLQLLVGKNDWNWTDLQQNTFEGLHFKLSNGPMLALPNNSDPYWIHSDASLLASGAVLEQLQEGKWKVIAYTSKSFSPAEWNYNTADWELLAIIHALKDWYHLLHSSSHKTKIFTDNRAITFFRQPQNLSYRHARWATYLSDLFSNQSKDLPTFPLMVFQDVIPPLSPLTTTKILCYYLHSS
jgi:RNase H-like domain found in reverse transcriptase